MNTYDRILEYLKNTRFRDLLYSIYNLAEEERYTHGLERLGYDNGIDSLEFAVLKVDDITVRDVIDFKNRVEQDIQDGNVVLTVLMYKGNQNKLVPVVVKPKGKTVEEILG